MDQSKSYAIIIGGRIGGLALGHALLQRLIPFRFVEREVSFASPSQEYRLPISGDGVHALQKCLPQSAWEKLEASAALSVVGMTKIDALTGKVVPRIDTVAVRGLVRLDQDGKSWN